LCERQESYTWYNGSDNKRKEKLLSDLSRETYKAMKREAEDEAGDRR